MSRRGRASQTMRRALAIVTVVAAVIVPSSAAQASEESQQSLAGVVILLDPGHQLGNSNPRFARQMSKKKFNGTSVKGCNTTGTATDAGFPEATFNWRVASKLQGLLEAQGAVVHLTRSRNSYDHWGPCVWQRAEQANRIGADVMINIHADGSAAKNRGFFVIAPGLVEGWTEDVVKPGRRLARAMIEGMIEAGAPPANYIDGQLMVSTNTTGLNFSDVPSVTVELGNMRNASDARRMSTTAGQRQYAQWLAAGVARYFAREGRSSALGGRT